MFNAQLISTTIATLKAAGITPPKLGPIRTLPPIEFTPNDLTEAILASDHDDPYEDPKVTALAAKFYLQSLTHYTQGFRQTELTRQAAEFEKQAERIFKEIHKAFNETAQRLVEEAQPIITTENPFSIDLRSAPQNIAVAAAITAQNIMSLEKIIKAWQDMWKALGRNDTRDVARPLVFINPSLGKWEETLRRNPTIWEAVRTGEPLTLAETPLQVNERYASMWDNERAARAADKEAADRKYGAALVEAYRS